MLDTFKLRLKAKSIAAGANLSQKRIDALADRLHKKFPEPKDDAEHDAHIDTVYDASDLKEFAQADDYQRTKEAKDKKDKADADKAAADKAGDPPSDEPAWFKAYREANDAKLNGLLQEKQTQSMQQKLTANEKLKGIDAKLYAKWQLPKTDEEIEAFADEVVSTYGHLSAPKEEGFVPGQQRQQAAAGTGKVDPAVKAFVEKNKAAEQQK